MRLFQKKYRNLPDEELMRFISLGEKAAFDQLYSRYAEQLHYFFWNKLKKDKEKAEDFVQDIFTKIIEKPHLFDINRSFKTWVFSVANNMCKNEYQKMEVRSPISNGLDHSYNMADDKHDPFETLNDALFIENLESVLSKMDIKHRSVFTLRYMDGFALQEIAEMEDIQLGTVKSRLFYATKHVMEALKAFHPNKKIAL